MRLLYLFLALVLGCNVMAQSDITADRGFFQSLYDSTFTTSSNPYSDGQWYDRLKINGYMQFRYNAKTNPKMKCEQCDGTYGGQEGFTIRRMRLKVSGFVHPKMYFYFQGDFASDGQNLGQLRDAYADVYFNRNNTMWFRFGQSKIMYGFDNMQSSQNRIPLDRSDPINSAIKNERDLMLSVYYTPKLRKKYFTDLVRKGLKGSGNYGMVSLGFYNGQTANALIPENNDGLHVVGHFSLPMLLNSGQYIEASLHAYYGEYQLVNTTPGVTAQNQFDDLGQPLDAQGAFFEDSRVGMAFMYYPEPFGFQMEYNIGIGPQYEPESNSVVLENLHGGYISLIGNVMSGKTKLYPFIRLQYYKGGKKFELDARRYDMTELEIGTEYSPFYPFELQITYAYARRYYSDGLNPVNNNTGHLLRFQFQVNY